MYFLFDIGGTKMRFATSHGMSLGKPKIYKTPDKFDDAIKIIETAFKEMTVPKHVRMVVGGIPRFANDKLSLWHTHDTKAILRKKLKKKVVLENDADLAGLGEAMFGAGKKYDISAYLTISTGVGGVKIDHNKIASNALGFEPRLGIIAHNPKRKQEPDIEDFISGRGIARRLKIEAKDLKSAKHWKEVNDWAKVLVNNAAAFWSPEAVIIGGSIGLDRRLKVGPIESYLKKRFKLMPKQPQVEKARLKDKSGLYGAMALARQTDKR